MPLPKNAALGSRPSISFNWAKFLGLISAILRSDCSFSILMCICINNNANNNSSNSVVVADVVYTDVVVVVVVVVDDDSCCCCGRLRGCGGCCSCSRC